MLASVCDTPRPPPNRLLMRNFSQAADNNKDAILAVLSAHMAKPATILEVGSGSGQHAIHFATRLTHLSWRPAELEEAVDALRDNLADAGIDNIAVPVALDVRSDPWPVAGVDCVYTANTLHIMSWPMVEDFMRGVDQALTAMDTALAESWAGRQPELPLTDPYDLLILASIIEKETGLPEERNEIAGVFIRRLNMGMRLQTDPTVIYGLGDSFDGDIRYRDLSTDTPYNTYTRAGLPPTPIAMPGRAALDAAAHPLSGSSLYFVATGDGGHYFSATLREHNAAVDRYQRKP